MLKIELVEHEGSVKTNYFDAAIVYINADGVEKPHIRFDIQTYEKVSRINSEKEGRSILSPVNAFFATLTVEEEERLYTFYDTMRKIVTETGRLDITDPLTRSNLIEKMYLQVDKVFLRMDIPARLIEFTNTDFFVYPDLGKAGKDPHHSDKMTFREKEYAELTALSIFCKIMAPVWGGLIMVFEQSPINSVYKEYFAQQIVDGILNSDSFTTIYDRFLYYANNLVAKLLKENDARKTGSALSSFILSRSKMTSDDFTDLVTATVVVKKLVRYDCVQRLQDGSPPNTMVYIDREIKEIVEANLSSLRKKIKELPQRDLPSRGGEENNTSVIDHISKISSKTADIPVFVANAAMLWDCPILLNKSGVNKVHWEALCEYYDRNPYPVNPLAISLMASFIGKQVKGSRLIDYFPFRLINRFTAMVQLYLAERGLTDIIPFLTCLKPDAVVDRPISLIGSRIMSMYQTIPEYLECKDLYHGYSEKSSQNPNERGRPLTQRISFEEQITRLMEWIVEETHLCNVPGWFWEHYPISSDPIVGKDCPLAATIPAQLYRFYLMFHSGNRPF